MNNSQKSFRLESICDPTPEMAKVVWDELNQFNAANIPEYFAALSHPENSKKPLNIFVFDYKNQVCGGVIAETQLLWLYILPLAIREDFRGQGIGTKLMKMAEAEAVQRGCKYALLDTMDFQAPDFYLKLGYVMVGQIDDWDSFGHTKFYFRKELT